MTRARYFHKVSLHESASRHTWSSSRCGLHFRFILRDLELPCLLHLHLEALPFFHRFWHSEASLLSRFRGVASVLIDCSIGFLQPRAKRSICCILEDVRPNAYSGPVVSAFTIFRWRLWLWFRAVLNQIRVGKRKQLRHSCVHVESCFHLRVFLSQSSPADTCFNGPSFFRLRLLRCPNLIDVLSLAVSRR